MTKRILVVEDQEDNRRILRDLLRHAEFDVIEVGDGEQALTAAVAHYRRSIGYLNMPETAVCSPTDPTQ
jgi:CheY-like chemotaxis protein